MKHTRIYYWLLYLCCLPFLAHAQVSVSAALDSARILIGDQTDLHLTASHPPGVNLQYPNLGEAQFGKLEIIRIGPIDTLKRTPEIITRQNVTITAFDSGYYAVPGLAFLYTVGNGSPQTAVTSPIGLEVATVPIDTSHIAPIKPIMREPVKLQDVLPVVYGLALIGGLGFLAVFLYRKFKKPSEIIEAPPIILPAHVIAFSKLDQLDKEKLWQKGDIKPYQSRLTYVIREYLEKRFSTHALESTTDEILQALRKEEFSGDLKANLREMLQMADLVKFAKAKPPAEFHQEMMDKAYQFVEATKKIEPSDDELAELAELENQIKEE